jgi:hypothetical protein
MPSETWAEIVDRPEDRSKISRNVGNKAPNIRASYSKRQEPFSEHCTAVPLGSYQFAASDHVTVTAAA